MQANKVFFAINTVLIAILILYFWLYFLPTFEFTDAYESIRNLTIVITVALIGAYIASSFVILGKV